MRKTFLRYKIWFLSILLAVAILVPMQNLLVEARSVISELTIATTDVVEDEGIDESDVGSGETASSEETTTSLGNIISTSTITDNILYSRLLKLYNEANGTSYSDIYAKMFKEWTTIDIGGGQIKSLEGLAYLDFSNLTTFVADMNEISTFDESCFSKTTSKFKSLSLAGNSISSFQITQLTGLYNINLSGNKLTSLDLSRIEGESGGNTTFTLNVAGNTISSLSNIKLPTKRIGNINLNVINNRITQIPSEYFTDAYTISAGIQGFSTLDDKFVTDSRSNVSVYRTHKDNVKIEIWKIDGERDELITSIADNNTVDADVYFAEGENVKTLNLAVGEYEYRYIVNGQKASEIDDDDEEYLSCFYLTSGRFNVIPQKPSYVFVYKDKEYKTLNKVTGVVTVKLSGEEGATIMYQVNNGEWVTGDTISCANGGTYSIKVKSVVGDMESEVENLLVRTSLNLYIPDGLMFVFVLLIALVLFLIVLPIISKKYFKKD